MSYLFSCRCKTNHDAICWRDGCRPEEQRLRARPLSLHEAGFRHCHGALLLREGVLRASGGKNWTTSEYDIKLRKIIGVFNGGRPIAGPKLGLREVFKPRVKKIRDATRAAGEHKHIFPVSFSSDFHVLFCLGCSCCKFFLAKWILE